MNADKVRELAERDEAAVDEYIKVSDLVDAVAGAALIPQALARRLAK